MSYLKSNGKKDAVKALEKAAALDASKPAYHTALGYAYLLRGNFAGLHAQAEAALALDPNDPDAHYLLGFESARDGAYATGYERAKKAIALKPNFAAAYLLKSETLVSSFLAQSGTVIKPGSRGDLLNEAAGDLEKFLSLAPNAANAKFEREYLESLRFFAGYYADPENQPPASLNLEPAADRTGIRIISKPRANYTDAARYANVSGKIRMLVGFTADGRIDHILLVHRLGYGLDEEAVRAARGIKFEPATRNGKPVPVAKMIEYTFTIY
ncbi:MAG: TonB family protein [Acidobacteria bacterium]|nr:TonB family protein [Acidobacteriota bacterium]